MSSRLLVTQPCPYVVLVSIDTLRADVAYSGQYPAFERLRREGTTFRNVVSAAPLTPTSHASILTGLQPPQHGIRHLFREKLKPGVRSLAQAFAQAGYDTGAVVSCPGMHSWYQFSRGFASYDDEIPRLADGSDPLLTVDVKVRGTALKRADLVISRALDWLRPRRGRPVFQFMHFFDCHWPYEPPQRYNLSDEANAYEGEVSYVDYHLGIYLEQLKHWGILEDTLLIVLSDHGEDLEGWYPNDHGGEALGHPEEKGHGCLLYDCTLMVPLIVRWPGHVMECHQVSEQVRLVDVACTIAELAGVDMGVTAGTSLAPALVGQPIADRPAFSETNYPREQYEATGLYPHLRDLRAVRLANRYKTVWQCDGERVEFYNLANDSCERGTGGTGPYLVREDPEAAEHRA